MNNQNRSFDAYISRAPGKIVDEQYYHLLELAARDAWEAMKFAEKLLGSGDGSNYAAVACNLVACIAFARLLESSEAEKKAVYDLPLWEGLPPTKAPELFVTLRLRYQAGRTKTPGYERARVHFGAIGEAYLHGIELQHVRGYIEKHGIENLYARSQRPTNNVFQGEEPVTGDYPAGRLVLPDLSGQQELPDPLDLPVDDEGIRKHPAQVPAASPMGSQPPVGKPPRTPKYAGDVPPACLLEVCLTAEQFDFVLGDDGPTAFMLHCRRMANGGSKWIRIDGNIVRTDGLQGNVAARI